MYSLPQFAQMYFVASIFSSMLKSCSTICALKNADGCADPADVVVVAEIDMSFTSQTIGTDIAKNNSANGDKSALISLAKNREAFFMHIVFILSLLDPPKETLPVQPEDLFGTPTEHSQPPIEFLRQTERGRPMSFVNVDTLQ